LNSFLQKVNLIDSRKQFDSFTLSLKINQQIEISRWDFFSLPSEKALSHVFSSYARLHQIMILIFNQNAHNMALYYDPCCVCFDKILVNHSLRHFILPWDDVYSKKRSTSLMEKHFCWCFMKKSNTEFE
jgi:hypothetical protein